MHLFIRGAFTFLCAFIFCAAIAQNTGNRLYQYYHSELGDNKIQEVNPFTSVNSFKLLDKHNGHLSDFSTIRLERRFEETMLQTRSIYLDFVVPTDETTIKLKFYRADPFTSDFTLRQTNETVEKEIVDHVPGGVYYRGYVDGIPNSIAMLGIDKDGLRIMYSIGGGNHVIQESEPGLYIHYNDRDILIENEFDCHTDTSGFQGQDIEKPSIELEEKAAVGSCVEVYAVVDFDAYQDNGSNMANTVNWLGSIWNEVETIYFNDGIDVAISSMLVYSGPDPYVSLTSTSAVLGQFSNNNVNNYDGRLAHFHSGRGLGGGVAYLDVLCSNGSPHAVSASLSSNVQAFPTYSWTVNVVAHEMGHNMGSPHSHNCGWNGSQIDDCGSQAGFPEGSCYDSNNPIIPAGGTIMSYCHLVGGVGIDFNEGFGPLPSALINSRFNNAPCQTGNCNTPNCNDGIWNGDEIGVDCGGSQNCGACSFGCVDTNAHNFDPSATTPDDSCLDCSDGIQNGDETGIDCGGTKCNPCWECDQTTYDSGGPNNGYSNNEDMVWTICPDPTEQLSVTFNYFDVEVANSVGSSTNGTGCWDMFFLYDGNSTSAPLIGNFCGENSSSGQTAAIASNNLVAPATFSATGLGNCLTLRFFSDVFVTNGGWDLDIECIAAESCEDGIQNQGEEGIDCGGPCDPCGPTLGNITVVAASMLGGSNTTGGNLMSDDLRTQGLIPLTEPYTALGFTHVGGGGGETINQSVLNTGGANAIVDWVFLELRDKDDPTVVLATRSALIQRDGNIVTTDGIFAPSFDGQFVYDEYYVAVRHRNHLGIMSAEPIDFSSGQNAMFDFTNSANSVFGTNAMNDSGAKRTMWPGNGNMDDQVVYQGSGSDLLSITQAVFSNPNNPNFQLSFPYAGYDQGDYNMDGEVVYQGSGSDILSVTQAVFTNSLNSSFQTTYPILEQLP